MKCRAGDNLVIHAATEYCQEGDILVISCEGDTTRSLMGDNMMAYLKFYKKVAALVVDGALRDVDEIQGWGFTAPLCTALARLPAARTKKDRAR